MRTRKPWPETPVCAVRSCPNDGPFGFGPPCWSARFSTCFEHRGWAEQFRVRDAPEAPALGPPPPPEQGELFTETNPSRRTSG